MIEEQEQQVTEQQVIEQQVAEQQAARQLEANVEAAYDGRNTGTWNDNN